MKYRVLLEQDEDGYFVAEVPSLPGCISQGDTREAALKNVREAIAGYLESLEEHGEPVPPAIHEEIVEVSIGGRSEVGGIEPFRLTSLVLVECLSPQARQARQGVLVPFQG